MIKPHANKGRKQSPEHIAARLAARKANGTDRGYKITKEGASQRYSAASKKRWEGGNGGGNSKEGGFQKGSKHTPETIAKMSETRKQMWADGRYQDKKPATRRAVSKMELSLKPYLEKMGYRHNTGEEIESFISCDDKTRLPDFINIPERKILEFFGDFWHAPEDEAVWIESYAAKNWKCTVLWEHDLPNWLEDHKDLVSSEEHQFALKTCRVRNSGKKE